MQTLILYYLSLKPTHGYEIQRFIEVNELNQWTKIQSGSIYYALAKLERDGLIERVDKGKVAEKSKKIYRITDTGRLELMNLVKETIASPISDVGSNKYFLFPMFTCLERPQLKTEIDKHIQTLQSKRDYLLGWKKAKIGEDSSEVEKCAFDMMLESLSMQIRWHEAILADYDIISDKRGQFDRLIASFEFSMAQNVNPDDVTGTDDLLQKAYGLY